MQGIDGPGGFSFNPMTGGIAVDLGSGIALDTRTGMVGSNASGTGVMAFPDDGPKAKPKAEAPKEAKKEGGFWKRFLEID